LAGNNNGSWWHIVMTKTRDALVYGGTILSADLDEVKCSSVSHDLSLILSLEVLFNGEQSLV